MPVVSRSNNQILPANARAADVASRAIDEIVPVQQRRMYDAFRVQGVESILYNHLKAGRKCTCQSGTKQINGLLDENGKASEGAINELITGTGMGNTGSFSFNVTPYNQDQARVTKEPTQSSPYAPVNKNQGVFDIVTRDEDFGFADIVDNGEDAFGDNGPIQGVDLDALVGDFDASAFGFSDASCPVCFGTGFVGGYSTFHAHRQVLTVADVMSLDGDIDLSKRPWVAHAESFSMVVILPRGAIGVDSFRVWNLTDPVSATYSIDGTAITSVVQLLSFCDGKKHVLKATVKGFWSHIEMQFQLTDEPVYFELPRRGKSADTALLEQTEPFQIVISPNIPTIDSTDIIVESQMGKVLLVQNVNPWNTRNRVILGWDAQVRVIQPQELYRILPKRGRIMNKDATTQMIRDNVSGSRRT